MYEEDQKVFLLPEHLWIRWYVSQCFDDRTLEAENFKSMVFVCAQL